MRTSRRGRAVATSAPMRISRTPCSQWFSRHENTAGICFRMWFAPLLDPLAATWSAYHWLPAIAMITTLTNPATNATANDPRRSGLRSPLRSMVAG